MGHRGVTGLGFEKLKVQSPVMRLFEGPRNDSDSRRKEEKMDT